MEDHSSLSPALCIVEINSNRIKTAKKEGTSPSLRYGIEGIRELSTTASAAPACLRRPVVPISYMMYLICFYLPKLI